MQQISSQKKVLIALGIIALGGVVLQQYVLRAGNRASVALGLGDSPERISVRADASGWKEYTNTKLGFSVKHPEDVTLRGTPESDLAILTMPTTRTGGKQALITLTKKKIPLGQAPYASMEEFWKDEERFIAANSGVTTGARYIDFNDRIFWEAREDNRQINYMGLHRYLKQGEAIYEVTLTIEGEKFLESAVSLYNEILATFLVTATP